MRTLYLSADERAALEHLARRDPKPYRRERATALLKIAAGQPAAVVARSGLLRPRDPDTVYSWLDRYEREGLAGLTIAPGRGRKPAAFSPAVQHAGEMCIRDCKPRVKLDRAPISTFRFFIEETARL